MVGCNTTLYKRCQWSDITPNPNPALFLPSEFGEILREKHRTAHLWTRGPSWTTCDPCRTSWFWCSQGSFYVETQRNIVPFSTQCSRLIFLVWLKLSGVVLNRETSGVSAAFGFRKHVDTRFCLSICVCLLNIYMGTWSLPTLEHQSWSHTAGPSSPPALSSGTSGSGSPNTWTDLDQELRNTHLLWTFYTVTMVTVTLVHISGQRRVPPSSSEYYYILQRFHHWRHFMEPRTNSRTFYQHRSLLLVSPVGEHLQESRTGQQKIVDWHKPDDTVPLQHQGDLEGLSELKNHLTSRLQKLEEWEKMSETKRRSWRRSCAVCPVDRSLIRPSWRTFSNQKEVVCGNQEERDSIFPLANINSQQSRWSRNRKRRNWMSHREEMKKQKGVMQRRKPEEENEELVVMATGEVEEAAHSWPSPLTESKTQLEVGHLEFHGHVGWFVDPTGVFPVSSLVGLRRYLTSRVQGVFPRMQLPTTQSCVFPSQQEAIWAEQDRQDSGPEPEHSHL